MSSCNTSPDRLQEPVTTAVDLNKKRKLHSQLGLPLAKHKYGDRSNPSNSEITADNQERGNPNQIREVSYRNFAEEPDQPEESIKDNISIIGENNTAVDGDANENGVVYSKPLFHSQALRSSSSYCHNALKDVLYSLESRNMTGLHGKDEKQANHGMHAYSEDTLEYEPVYVDIHNKYPGLGLYGDYSTEFEGNIMDDETNDMLLYPNEITEADFVLSSGRWSLQEDAQLGAKKPTIDQEFEQYFSMLML